jgi:hypothetical protein
MTDTAYRTPRGEGWVQFAVLMLAFAGTMTVIDGIVALARSKFYVGDAVYVFGDLRTWGWIMLVLGAIELFAAATAWSGSQLGRWLGVAAAALNGIGQMLFMQAYPWWSVVVFAADVLVVYALVAYGGRDYSRA